MAVNKERVAMLVAALRSGSYVQGQNRLARTIHRDGTTHYCCLGVACEIALANGAPVRKTTEYDEATDQDWIRYTDIDSGKSETHVMPPSVIDWFGFNASDPYLSSDGDYERRTAAEVNDQGGNFAEIADMFKERFLKPAEVE